MKIKEFMRRSVATVGEDDNLALAQQLMLWNNTGHLPVLRAADGRLTGMLSERDILRFLQRHPDDPAASTRPVRELMHTPVVHVHSDTDAEAAAEELTTRKVGCLPVLESGTLVGLVTASDLLRALTHKRDRAANKGKRSSEPASAKLASAKTASGNGGVSNGKVGNGEVGNGEVGNDGAVASIMFPEPIAVHEDDSLVTTAQRMARARARHACVVDGDGCVIGILSDRDIRSALGDPRYAQKVERVSARVAELRVRDAMTTKPRTIHQDEPIRTALEIFASVPIGALPVVSTRGRLRGIVSYADVLSHMVRA